MSQFHADIVRRLEYYYPGNGWTFEGEDQQSFNLSWAEGNPDPAPTYEDLIALDPPPPRPHVVRKLLIIDRLIAANLFDTAMFALGEPGSVNRERWNAATEINSNDAAVRGLLTAIGADPDVILAPEE